MKKIYKIVCIGGGTGLSKLLGGLKLYFSDISAIVAMTDDGLSTGRIRRDFNTLPSGDIRKCLTSLSEDKVLKQVFDYRFQRGKGLAKHSLGNLIILALEKITGNYDDAISEASKILKIKNKVIPSTLENVNLGGKLDNGTIVIGERKLFLAGIKSRIIKVWTVPQNVRANPKALMAIEKSDIIIIGPGSFYTSIVPNILLPEIRDKIVLNKSAKKIYVCNVSTERGETQGYSVEDHIDALNNYIGSNVLDYCLINNKVVIQSKKEYKLGEVKNITTDKKFFCGCKLVLDDLIDIDNPLYHNSIKLVRAIRKIIYES
jgi:uncharacterized cofD-like protein